MELNAINKRSDNHFIIITNLVATLTANHMSVVIDQFTNRLINEPYSCFPLCVNSGCRTCNMYIVEFSVIDMHPEPYSNRSSITIKVKPTAIR